MPDDTENGEIIENEDHHPLFGRVYADESQHEPVFILPPGQPIEERGTYVGKLFCDSCGFTGGHAPDCPVTLAPPEDLEPPHDEPAEPDDAVIPLARRLAGAILRKLARAIEGRR